jgi:hypothetical protein
VQRAEREVAEQCRPLPTGLDVHELVTRRVLPGEAQRDLRRDPVPVVHRRDRAERVEREERFATRRLVVARSRDRVALGPGEQHRGVREERDPGVVLAPGDHADPVDVRRGDGVDRVARVALRRERARDRLLVHERVRAGAQDLVGRLRRVDDDAAAGGLDDPDRGGHAHLPALGPGRDGPLLCLDDLPSEADRVGVDEDLGVRDAHEGGVADREPERGHDRCVGSFGISQSRKLSWLRVWT